MLLWFVAGGAAAQECVGDEACACERQRLASVLRALESVAARPAVASTADTWSVVVEETCRWAVPTVVADPGERCTRVTECARLHAEDRLARAAPAWDAALFASVTEHHGCTPADGPACAVRAAEAEDARLAALLDDLGVTGISPDVAQVAWSRYREAVCREDPLALGPDRAWSAAACRAVETARRTALLTRLAGR